MQVLTSFGIHPGLERIEYLLQQMGKPHMAFPCVHIAGTNGKGTVTELISRGLSAAGYRTGKFTSPHLHDYTERIQIDGKPISYEEMNRYLDEIDARIPAMEAAGLEHPTEFEVLTAMAFSYFRDRQVDVAVLEVGLGGTLDSTNVITPEVSVITGIAYDHMAILGDTLAEIAANKAGIIKEGVPVVIGEMPDEAADVIYRTAFEKHSSLYRSRDCVVEGIKSREKGQKIHIQGVFPKLGKKLLDFHLLGAYQRRNLATALTALAVLKQRGWKLSAKTVRCMLKTVSLSGRLEVVSEKPLVLIDVAHNPQGAEALGESLKELFPDRKKILVCGILDDKDAASMMQSLSYQTKKVIFTQPLGPRGKNWKRLRTLWAEKLPDIPAEEEADIEKAAQRALEDMEDTDYLLLTGSFYLMDPARKFFLRSGQNKNKG